MIMNPTDTQVFDAVFNAIRNESYEVNPTTGLLKSVKKCYKNLYESTKRIPPYFAMELISKNVKAFTMGGAGGKDIHTYTYNLGFCTWNLSHDKSRDDIFAIAPVALNILRPNTFDVFYTPANINNIDLAPFEDKAEMVWLCGFELVGEVIFARPR